MALATELARLRAALEHTPPNPVHACADRADGMLCVARGTRAPGCVLLPPLEPGADPVPHVQRVIHAGFGLLERHATPDERAALARRMAESEREQAADPEGFTERLYARLQEHRFLRTAPPAATLDPGPVVEPPPAAIEAPPPPPPPAPPPPPPPPVPAVAPRRPLAPPTQDEVLAAAFRRNAGFGGF